MKQEGPELWGYGDMKHEGSGIWRYWDMKRVFSGIWDMRIRSTRSLGSGI